MVNFVELDRAGAEDGGRGSMLLGSVSSAVLHHADRPMLVVHRRGDDDADQPTGG